MILFALYLINLDLFLLNFSKDLVPTMSLLQSWLHLLNNFIIWDLRCSQQSSPQTKDYKINGLPNKSYLVTIRLLGATTWNTPPVHHISGRLLTRITKTIFLITMLYWESLASLRNRIIITWVMLATNMFSPYNYMLCINWAT